jgi:hypothetical protein
MVAPQGLTAQDQAQMKEVITTYQAMRAQITTVASKLAELTAERAEHAYVVCVCIVVAAAAVVGCDIFSNAIHSVQRGGGSARHACGQPRTPTRGLDRSTD